MTNNEPHDKKGPAVKFPPPLIFVVSLLAGYGLHQVTPLELGMFGWGKFLGSALIVMALFILLALLIAYFRAKTNIEPWKPTSHLITSGLYARSRNPIYAAFCLINIGAGCYLNSFWVLLRDLSITHQSADNLLN